MIAPCDDNPGLLLNNLGLLRNKAGLLQNKAGLFICSFFKKKVAKIFGSFGYFL